LSAKPVRKITKVAGRSYSISLPMEAIKEFGWKEKQKLTVQVDLKNKKLIIRDWKGK
jgi:bifunctional DNA-binding transcriptional regulator/antitoxin component of YhaV-PrlF toxin-antitoxin module